MATITTIQETDYQDDSRTDINNNFDNLNTDKVEKSGDTMTGELSFSGADHAGLKVNSLTTAQRDALTPANGMVIYNTTVSSAQIYQNGSWQDFNFISYNCGDGSDGDVEISGSTTLTRDMYYNNLTVNGTLTTNGFIVFVKGTLNGVGTIKAPQGNAGGNGSGQTKGTGGSATTTGRFKNTAGGDGGQGGDIGVNGANASATNAVVGIGVTQADSKGGNGGVGQGDITGGTGATGSATSTNSKIGTSLIETIYGLNIGLTGATLHYGSAGQAGGGGGGGGWSSSGGEVGGGGGGGGASGGVVWLVVNNWAGTFTIEAKGGDGGNGASRTSAGGGGGGQGGAGGVAVVIYNSKNWTGSYDLAGGTKGIGGVSRQLNSGANGSDGATGNSIEINISSILH